METAHPSQATSTQSTDFGKAPSGAFRAALADAARFWELRRLVYNFLLAAVVVIWIVASWPHFRPVMTLHSLLLVSILGLLANLCYCAAYLVDIPMLCSPLGAAWRRWRWGLWLMGMLFALLFENYWIADEIYPYVQ